MTNELNYRNKLLLKKLDANILGLNIKQFTVNDIDDVGYEEFNRKRQFIFLNKNTFSDDALAMEIDKYMMEIKETLMFQYQDILYDIDYNLFDLISYIPFINDMFIEFLEFFTINKIHKVYHVPEDDEMVIIYDDKLMHINRNQFDDLLRMFSILNFSTDLFNEDSKIAKAKEVYDFDKQVEELKGKYSFIKEKKEDITFNSILSWLCNDGKGYTHENIGDRTIYQIMDSYSRRNYMSYCDLINNVRGNGLCTMDDKALVKINYAFDLYNNKL